MNPLSYAGTTSIPVEVKFGTGEAPGTKIMFHLINDTTVQPGYSRLHVFKGEDHTSEVSPEMGSAPGPRLLPSINQIVRTGLEKANLSDMVTDAEVEDATVYQYDHYDLFWLLSGGYQGSIAVGSEEKYTLDWEGHRYKTTIDEFGILVELEDPTVMSGDSPTIQAMVEAFRAYLAVTLWVHTKPGEELQILISGIDPSADPGNLE